MESDRHPDHSVSPWLLDCQSGVWNPIGRASDGTVSATSDTFYGNTRLNNWGLGNQDNGGGTIYIEPGPGKNLVLTDSWQGTGIVDSTCFCFTRKISATPPFVVSGTLKSARTSTRMPLRPLAGISSMHFILLEIGRGRQVPEPYLITSYNFNLRFHIFLASAISNGAGILNVPYSVLK